jgi:hypothetical protein
MNKVLKAIAIGAVVLNLTACETLTKGVGYLYPKFAITQTKTVSDTEIDDKAMNEIFEDLAYYPLKKQNKKGVFTYKKTDSTMTNRIFGHEHDYYLTITTKVKSKKLVAWGDSPRILKFGSITFTLKEVSDADWITEKRVKKDLKELIYQYKQCLDVCDSRIETFVRPLPFRLVK